MATKKIFVEPLKKEFCVGIKNANKQARNKSYANATNCHGVRVRQEYRCTECDEVVDQKEIQRKIVKIGKEDYLIDAQELKKIQEHLESMSNIKLTSFLKELPQRTEDYFEGLIYAFPERKLEGQYKELSELLKGRYAIGTGVFGRNEFQIVAYRRNDGLICIRKLVNDDQRYGFDENFSIPSTDINSEILAIENQILDKATIATFDITQFRDSRIELEENMIEQYVLHGKQPSVVEEAKQSQETDELQRLKELMQ